MKKPLELTIHPPMERCSIYPDCIIAYHEVGNYGPDKHLTDSEAAAEYWMFSRNLFQGQAASGKKPRPLWQKRLDTLRRFAELPHHDEAQS